MANKEVHDDIECCMCGDYGLPNELFRCKSCLFRSQHRYCSNVYPKAKSYQFCNWCLERITPPQQESSSSNNLVFTSNNDLTYNQDNINTHKKIKINIRSSSSSTSSQEKSKKVSLITNGSDKWKNEGSSSSHKQNLNLKSSPSDISSSTSAKKGVVKRVFRGQKVQRYKLLAEVCN